MTDYNYDNFSSDDYDFDVAAGPSVGTKAPDFDLITSAGEKRRLLDFKGDFLVLELGSITCPLFQSRRTIMATLKSEFDGIDSVVLYIREAHPGASIPSHKTARDKRACARRLQDEDGEARTILVDDFAGSAHMAYGGMPNAVYIINRDGCVLFRSDWNNPAATKRALGALVQNRPISAKSYFRPALPLTVLRTLSRAGKGSGFDFLKSFPSLIWNNLVKRNLRILFNQPEKVSRDTTC